VNPVNEFSGIDSGSNEYGVAARRTIKAVTNPSTGEIINIVSQD
jgi:hypothetical protein